ncbi:hypothetical protein Cpin_4281 [Chitinophaga pinensis DSM 2588]|uniref:Uncharacterized protein n=1 Tax=Chitinophaga pinensis (strain ATCC 43595 / DSM 2588 / LMG 13176 / NBRC 15968 / NCIMB 11800 / UQM 2034) TaxID=485918 RepID=A0A979GY79_CHIPD|nr:hypothetical protein Cpin_4281 [Chitinophaga pinensis DSM 2588]
MIGTNDLRELSRLIHQQNWSDKQFSFDKSMSATLS